MAAELPAGHSPIEAMTFGAETISLGLAGAIHLVAHGRAGCAVCAGGQLLKRNGGHFDVNVDAIEKRAADTTDIALDLHRIAFACPTGISQVAAGTWIH